MPITASKKGKSIFIVVLYLIANPSLLGTGQDLKLWRDLKPQFFQQIGQQQLTEGIVSSSTYFFDELSGWIVGTNGEWLGKSRGMMARTQDGGRIWNVVFSAVPSEFSDVFFVSRRKGWIAGSEQSSENRSVGLLMETTDSGESWQKRTVGNFAESDFLSIYFSNEEKGFIAGGTEIGGQRHAAIFRTFDGGKNWNLAYAGKSNGLLRDIKFDKLGEVGWAVGDEGEILSSKDGGKTWQKQKTNFDGDLLGTAVLDPQEAWISATDSSLLHTNDGGNTWAVVSPKIDVKAVKDSTVWFSGVFFDSRTHGWVCGSNGIILSTEDGGRSWQLEAIGRGEFLYKMIPLNKRIIAVGKDATLLQRKLDIN